jgi:SAM-dependent methyltransferase
VEGEEIPVNLQLGPMHGSSFTQDPKHLGFVLSRYKFVAKMLAGCLSVLEIGCGEGTGGRLVRAHVGYLLGIDSDKELIRAAQIPVMYHDILSGPVDGHWDAAYALDVMEHIAIEQEDVFLGNITKTLLPHGALIIGMPSLESQKYASALSRVHHINCKTEDDLRATMLRHFYNVYMFGMNDETLHCGFGPMCHYRLAVCAGKR